MSARVRIDAGSRMPLDPVLEEEADTPPPAVRSDFVELLVKSNFSFLQAGSSPEDHMRRARELEYDAAAITDRDGLYGVVRAHEEAKKQGVRLVVGCELTWSKSGVHPPYETLTVLVQNHDGYSNLCRILTESHRLHPKGELREAKDHVPKNCFAGVAIDFICQHASGLWVIAHDGAHDGAGGGIAGSSLGKLKDAFGERCSLALHRHFLGSDRARGKRVVAASKKFAVPIVATNAVVYATPENKPVYDVVCCIREGITLENAGRKLAPNAEAHWKSEREMKRIFGDHPEWIMRSRDIADACTFSMKELRYRFPCELEEPAFEGETSDQALRRLSYEGARVRYPQGIPEKVIATIEKELALISQLDVSSYFLSVQSIVNIARRRDILCQGRGSAANSAVCYCLGITAVNPAETSLLFERFLSIERREPPDIDVDFEHERREEVIQELYNKYGRERAAMVSEVICYRGKSALREVGKVFGFSLDDVDRLSKIVNWWDGVNAIGEDRLRDAGFDAKDERVNQVLTFARKIQGFPRHLSIHVGGFVLSAEPLTNVAPVEPATMPGRTIIPWDKDDLDTLGFFKVDVLALGILTAIRKTLALIQVDDENVRAKTAIDQLAKIPLEDPTVYDALCRADTVGVFQIESRAQMSMLPRLRPRKFYDVVIEVAIVRPGPIQGGMVHPYLRRRNGEEKIDAPHPSLVPILERTLGVPLFQEQAMQIAIVGAGYTGGEADQLRRDMAAWRKNGNLERHRGRLLEGFRARGISDEFAEKLFAQIQGFGDYGFPESHAVSFALLAYASAWLKVFHPAAFAAGLINSLPMGFYSANTIIKDAQKHGVEVRPIRIEHSHWDCTLERDPPAAAKSRSFDFSSRSAITPATSAPSPSGPALRIGFRQIKGLRKEHALRIEEARAKKPFESLTDLATRARLDRKDIELLAEAGAFETMIEGRREALWKVREPSLGALFRDVQSDKTSVGLPKMTRAEQLLLDYERTGLSVTDHPMHIARANLPAQIKRASELSILSQGDSVSSAGMVICRQRPGTASGVVFITMEDETGFINLILYSRVFEQFHHVATTSSLLLAEGVIEREGDVIYIVTRRLSKISMQDRAVPEMSRDFH